MEDTNKKDNLLTEKKQHYKKPRKWPKTSHIVFWWKAFVIWFKSLGNNPLYAPGVHLIEAPSGTGKTLLANIVLQRTTRKNGFWYVNCDQFDQDRSILFDPADLFEDAKQVRKLPYKNEINGRKVWTEGIIFDELNLNFNRRLNKSTAYNNLFIGLMEMIVSHRHQRLNRVYFLSQAYALNDTQIQQVFKFKHVIYSNKRYSYYYFKVDNKMIKVPKVLFVESFIRTENRDAQGMPEYAHIKTTKLKIDPKRDLETYNHLGYASKYADLPDYNQFMSRDK